MWWESEDRSWSFRLDADAGVSREYAARYARGRYDAGFKSGVVRDESGRVVGEWVWFGLPARYWGAGV